MAVCMVMRSRKVVGASLGTVIWVECRSRAECLWDVSTLLVEVYSWLLLLASYVGAAFTILFLLLFSLVELPIRLLYSS